MGGRKEGLWSPCLVPSEITQFDPPQAHQISPLDHSSSLNLSWQVLWAKTCMDLLTWASRWLSPQTETTWWCSFLNMENYHRFLPHNMSSQHTESGCMRNRRNTEGLFSEQHFYKVPPRCRAPSAEELGEAGHVPISPSRTCTSSALLPTPLTCSAGTPLNFTHASPKNRLKFCVTDLDKCAPLTQPPMTYIPPPTPALMGRPPPGHCWQHRGICLRAHHRCIRVYFM